MTNRPPTLEVYHLKLDPCHDAPDISISKSKNTSLDSRRHFTLRDLSWWWWGQRNTLDVWPFACEDIFQLLADDGDCFVQPIVCAPDPTWTHVAGELFHDGKGEVNDFGDKAVMMIGLIRMEAIQIQMHCQGLKLSDAPVTVSNAKH
jgi:hypothetical protein